MTEEKLIGPYGGAPESLPDGINGYGVNAWWFHGFDDSCFERAAVVGVAPCVELKTFRADFTGHPELIPTGADGRPIRYGNLVQGVCLSRTEFLAEIEERLEAGLAAYRPRGVWYDYLTYAGWFETPEPDLQESCFCPDCVSEFCGAEGIDAESPKEILAGYGERWTRHKCLRIASLGRRFSEIVKRADPDCVIGVYLCPWRPEEFDGALTRIFAQDPSLLAAFTDVFTPLIYCRKSGRAADWGKRYLEGAADMFPGGAKVQPILDILDFPASLEAVAESAAEPSGVQLFGGSGIFADAGKTAAFERAAAQISR